MAPGGLVEVRVSWPGHPRYLKKREGRTRLAQGSAITRRGLKAQLAFPHGNLGLGSSAFGLEYGHPIPTMTRHFAISQISLREVYDAT